MILNKINIFHKNILRGFIKKLIFPVLVFASITYLINFWILSKTESLYLQDLSLINYFLFFLLLGLVFITCVQFYKYVLSGGHCVGTLLLAFLLIYVDFTPISLLGVTVFLTLVYLIVIKVFQYKFPQYISFVLLGMFILLTLLYKIDFAIDEGFLILLTFIFCIILSLSFLFLSLLKGKFRITWKAPKILKVFMITLLLFANAVLFFLGYWGNLGILGKEIKEEKFVREEVFKNISKFNDYADEIPPKDNVEVNISNKINNYLSVEMDESRLDVYALRYLFFEEEKSLEIFRSGILDKVNKNEYLGSEGSIKAWQFSASSDAYYYLRVLGKNSEAFSKKEKDEIENWFYKVNERAYENSLADYSYGVLFKKVPNGLYLNQDIGYGMISIFSKVLKDRYPEIVKKNYAILENEKPGWYKNFKNSDDGISYHQEVWIQNSFLIYDFGNIGNLENAKLSTDWIMYQSPFSNGIHPNYNSFNENSALISLIIGNYYYNDPEYQYLINNFIEYDIDNKVISENLIGFDLIPQVLNMSKPQAETMIISSTTGLNSHLSIIQPDKLVIRKSVNNNEILLIFNLRASGWHKYHSTGELISILINGEEIAGQNINKLIKHNWLPKGKASHRDLKIQSDEIILPLVRSSGIEKIFYYAIPIDNNLLYKDNCKFIQGPIKEVDGDIFIQIDNNSYIEVSIGNDDVDIKYNYSEEITNLNFRFTQ